MSDDVKRRLAVVAAFDVVGYSRLMEADEEGTHRRMRDISGEVIQPLLSRYHGRLCKLTGDGGIAEFVSVIEAARCALELHRAMAVRNRPQAAGREILFRVGISLSDIIVEPEDIYGEGVNIAARLQELADGGGICVTGNVAEELRGKVDGRLVDLGTPKLKNLTRPVQVFRLVDGGLNGEASPLTPPSSAAVPGFGRPAIVVLPLDTFTASQDEDYFADGLTEDITTALATWRFFPVISRNSAFTYKGRKFDIKSVGRELGARYLLEGSVRRHHNRARITIQLIEADTGTHLLAEQYDREIDNLLGLQDEIATSIVGVLEPELLRVERDRASTRPATFAAYDLLQRGLWHHYRRTREDSALALTTLRKAMAADPNYAQIAAALSICLSQSMLSGWLDNPKAAVGEAVELGQRAVFLDARDPMAHFSLGVASMHAGQRALAVRELAAAARLNPSYAGAHALLGNQHNYGGRPDEAFACISRALRLSPNDPSVFLWMPALAASHYLGGHYGQAIEAANQGLALKPDYLLPVRYLVAALGQLGRRDEASQWLGQLRTLDKSRAETAAFLGAYYENAPLQHILDGLAKAGFD